MCVGAFGGFFVCFLVLLPHIFYTNGPVWQPDVVIWHHALGILGLPQPDFILLNWCLMVHSRDGPEFFSLLPRWRLFGYLQHVCSISKEGAWPHWWCLRRDDFRVWACWNEASSGAAGVGGGCGQGQGRVGKEGGVWLCQLILLICRLPWAAHLWNSFLKCPHLRPRHDHSI